jgi:hypothetical protein
VDEQAAHGLGIDADVEALAKRRAAVAAVEGEAPDQGVSEGVLQDEARGEGRRRVIDVSGSTAA